MSRPPARRPREVLGLVCLSLTLVASARPVEAQAPATRPEPRTTTAAIAAQARAQLRTVPMPNLVGQNYQAALQDPAVTRFKIRLAAQQTPTDKARPGTIVGQRPEAGAPILPGATAGVFVATEPPRRIDPVEPGRRLDPAPQPVVRMPAVEGLVEVEALRALETRDFKVSRQYVTGADAKDGVVVAQKPAAGTLVSPGSGVSIAVARTSPREESRVMPRLIGQLLPAAAGDARVRALELRLAPRSVQTRVAPPGVIIDQKPAPGEPVKVGTIVALVVAAAPEQPPRPPDEPQRPPDDPRRPRPGDDVPRPPVVRPLPPDEVRPALVTMPNLVGRPFAQAARADDVVRPRLSLVRRPDERAFGPPDIITAQSVPAGQSIELGSAVTVAVATGVLVPDVLRRVGDEAERVIADAGLKALVSTAPSEARAGTVVTQTPEPNVRVARGAAVAITVAAAPRVDVPDVVGRVRDDAERMLDRLRLKVEVVDDARAAITPGQVATQQPAAGTSVAMGSAVRIAVATGVSVPPLAGLSDDEAQRVVAGLGLSYENSEVETDQAQPGRVFSQQPAAGTVVARTSRVRVALAVAPSVTVPDVRRMPRADAARALEAVRLEPSFTDDPTSTEPPDIAVTQNPLPGTRARPGLRVQVAIATGVVVPDVVGQSRDAAVAAATQAGLATSLQAVDATASDGTREGRIARQDPAAGTRVARGASVTLFLPLSRSVLVRVPDLSGRSRAEADRILSGIRLVARFTDVDSQAPAGTVVTQRPAPGADVALDSQVSVVLARAAAVPVAVTPAAPVAPIVAPLLPVWAMPLGVALLLVGLSVVAFVRANRPEAPPPAQASTVPPPPSPVLQPRVGDQQVRLEVYGRSLVELEIRIRAMRDDGDQSLTLATDPRSEIRTDLRTDTGLLVDERRIYE